MGRLADDLAGTAGFHVPSGYSRTFLLSGVVTSCWEKAVNDRKMKQNKKYRPTFILDYCLLIRVSL
jgi:hypothetical protein